MGGYEESPYSKMEKYLWCYCLNQRLNYFASGNSIITRYLEDKDIKWYKKLDLVEATLSYLDDDVDTNHCLGFSRMLNYEFKRLNFAYRVIENKIVEVTAEEEIAAIETALQNQSNGVREHLHTALELLSKRPEGDYRNSIKESISAVETIVRKITGANTLNFTELERKGVTLPSVLKQAFDKLYGYTNDKSTGIRHALMDDANAPGADEAIFMLISCSAFVNYLTKKTTKI